MIRRTGNVGYEMWESAALISWFGFLGAEVTGAVARETRCTQLGTWTSKCLIPAYKRQTGSWWRRYRGIDVKVVFGLALTYAPSPLPGSICIPYCRWPLSQIFGS